MSEAYEILSNPEKKELYDKYGIDGVKDGGGHGGDDIFSQMFGFGGGARKQASQVKKAKPVLREVKVTLDEIFTGKMINLEHKRKRVCQNCNGAGGTDVKKCLTCKGQGMITKMMMIGPGMYTQSTQPCKECKGEGKIIEKNSICKECKGDKMSEEKKMLELAIEPGAPDDFDYILHGESDEYVQNNLT